MKVSTALGSVFFSCLLAMTIAVTASAQNPAHFAHEISSISAKSGGATAPLFAPAATFTTLHNFNVTDGANPEAELLQGTDGNLYGTASEGGTNNHGTVFKITTSGTLTTLYSFCSQTNCTDGAEPEAGLIQSTNGNFYGTAYEGGAENTCFDGDGCGTVFKVTARGTLKTLYAFAGYPTNGQYPRSGLVQAADGDFYGTTYLGGTDNNDFGTVFKITPSGMLTTLHDFDYNDAGGLPRAGLIEATNGNLYGTTQEGGTHGSGAIFKIIPPVTLTTLYNFCSQNGCTGPEH
jgi:uncharacterized repeat protein (TIGR03803 family)